MKRLFIILLAAFLLMGCEIDALNYYQEAVKKTETIESGKSVMELNLEVSFSEKLKEEQADLVDLLKEINFSSNAKFDKQTKQSMIRQYIGNDAIGFDTIYYRDKDESQIKVPFTGKFLKLNPEDLIDGIDFSVYDEEAITDETAREIKLKWFNLVNEDDVVNLGDEVIDTPEGEVKVKKMVVSFSDDQIHQFLDEVLVLVSKDEVFKEQVKKYPTYYFEDNKLVETNEFQLDVEDAIDSMRRLFDDIIVNEMKFTSYIDIDKYMIHHEYEVNLSFKGNLEGIVESVKFKGNYQLFDLHETNEFEFPTLTDNNTITIKEILELVDFEIPIEE